MERNLEKYKVYNYIKNNALPNNVIELIINSIDDLSKLDPLKTILVDELNSFFDIVRNIYCTPINSSFFQRSGAVKEYKEECISILEENFDLLNNETIDDIIINLLDSEEQYNIIQGQITKCASLIEFLYIDHLFLDHYYALEKAKSIDDIESILERFELAISEIELKRHPGLIRTKKHKKRVKAKLQALIDSSNTRIKYLEKKIQKSAPDNKKNQPIKRKISFEDLFQPLYKDHVEQFVQILREVIPELVNVDGHWIGAKNAARIYFYALKDNGIIKANSTHDDAINAFDSKFPSLGRAFMKNNKKETQADIDYQDLPQRITLLKSHIYTKSN